MEKRICSKKYVGYTMSIFIVFLPFIMIGLVLFLNGYKLNFSMLLPVWNDEVGWWNQVNAMVHYGKTLGYNGYNGTHAVFGTSGPWGPFALLPYFLFGKIFGWKLYSMAVANMSFLSLALFIYCFLTKPGNRQKIYLIIIYSFMMITVGYSMTSMSEGLRYALGIILAGLLIWIERRTQENGYKLDLRNFLVYSLIAILVYYAVFVYMIFALTIPLFCWFIFRKINPLLRAAISFFVTVVLTVIANYISILISAPYVTSTLSNIANIIKEHGPYTGGCIC